MSDILLLLIVIIGGTMGFISSVGIVVSLIGTIAYKCYRKVKYNISLFD